jgi:hypothetical protein
MPDDATVNDSAPEEKPPTSERGGETEQDAPSDAAELREDAKEEIQQAAESEPERHEAQDGPKATPTQHEAEAVTASGTPSGEAQEALQEKLEAQGEEETPDGKDEESEGHRTARELVAEGEAPLAPLPGRAEPADDGGSPAEPAESDEVQDDQEQASAR